MLCSNKHCFVCYHVTRMTTIKLHTCTACTVCKVKGNSVQNIELQLEKSINKVVWEIRTISLLYVNPFNRLAVEKNAIAEFVGMFFQTFVRSVP